MTLLNFSDPLTPVQLAAIERLAGQKVERVIEAKTQFDHAQPFIDQVRRVVDSVSLSPQEWQTLLLLINLPSFNVIAALVLAELHGRMGYFPAVLRLRPVTETTPPRFEVEEIINLQAVRDGARQWR